MNIKFGRRREEDEKKEWKLEERLQYHVKILDGNELRVGKCVFFLYKSIVHLTALLIKYKPELIKENKYTKGGKNNFPNIQNSNFL